MKLTIVGCAPAWTRRPGRASSSYLVEHDGRAVVLDLGQGSFAELARYYDAARLDAVLISHLHADHLVDLVPLRHFLKYEAAGGGGGIRLHAPRDLRPRFDAFQAERDFLHGLPGEALEPGSFGVGGLLVEARRVTHIPDSFAFRVTPADGAGPGIVYSGDCAEPNDLLPLIHTGDTLLCEAALGTGSTGGGPHMTAQQAAGAAARGGASRLILTHILDQSDHESARLAAAGVFDGELLVASPGLALETGGNR